MRSKAAIYILAYASIPLFFLLSVQIFAMERNFPYEIDTVKGADTTIYRLYSTLKESGKKAEAMEALEEFLRGIHDSASNEGIALLASELSNYYYIDHSDFTNATFWEQVAIRQYKRRGDIGNAARCEYELAKIYYRRGDYHLTLKHLSEAYPYFVEYNDRSYIIQSYNLFGIIYLVCKDYDNAKHYFDLYEEEIRKENDTISLVVALNNQTAYYQAVSDSANIRMTVEESIAISKAMKDSSLLCRSYINMAAHYINSGDDNKAKEYLDAAAPYIVTNERRGEYYHFHAYIENNAGRHDSAKKYLEKAISSYSEGEHMRELLSCYDFMVEVSKACGDKKWQEEAILKYHEIFMELGEDGDSFLELFQYQRELIKQKEMQEKEVARREKTIYWIISVGAVIVVVLTGLFTIKRKNMMYRLNQKELETQLLLNKKREQEIRSRNDLIEVRRAEQLKYEKKFQELAKRLEAIVPSLSENSIKEEVEDISLLLREGSDDEHWEEMNRLIPEFSNDLLRKLFADFPSLTINEKRLCVLLNLNLSSKEISKITGQTPHSINIARYRLRSKLGLNRSELSLQEFIAGYSSDKA